MAIYDDLLPPLSTIEFSALKADIKARGVLYPVLVDEDGNVLDGRNRLKIDPKAPTEVVHGLSPAEKEAFVFRANLARRNLSPDQKLEAGQKMKATAKRLREENPKKWTQKAVAEALGVAQNTVSVWFSTNINGDNTSKPAPDARVKLTPAAKEKAVEQIARGKSQAQVAADLSVSQKTISNVVKAANKQSSRARCRTIPTKPNVNSVVVLLADPPWQYDFATTDSRKIENQYPTATPEEIGTHLREWGPELAENCVLFMWATAPKLKEALQVMALWGFEYKTHAVWDKERMGMGYWFRGQHELLLVGTRGNLSPPDSKRRVSSVFREKRDNKHSKKPTCVYTAIERMFPKVPKFEMYQRDPRDGWLGGGNECRST